MSRFLCALICLAWPAFSQIAGFRFEANRGQADTRFRYLAKAHGRPVGLTDAGLESQGFQLQFAGGNSGAAWEPAEQLPGTTSYFIGADASRWVKNAPQYGRLLRRAVYPGIDIVFRGAGEKLEFDFQVAPAADPSRIRLAWSAGADLHLLPNGDLQTPAAVLRRPAAWQTIGGRKVEVAASFRLDTARREATLALGAYDRGHELVIDPVLDTWAFTGGAGMDRITAVAPGMVAGVTESAGWINTPRRGKDIFVCRDVNCTVYGGSGDEEITAAVSSSSDSALVVGWTNSPDFPITSRPAATQPVYGGGKRDGFLLYADGNSLEWSSYFGGTGDDAILAVALAPGIGRTDPVTVLIAGETTSPNLPAEKGVQTAPGGGRDGFLAQLTPDLTGVQECSYWGGAGDDAITAMDVTPASFWIGGRSTSSSIPNTEPQRPAAGGVDGFLARLDRAGGTRVGLFTFLGGSGDDEVRAVRMGQDRRVWVGGVTTSADLPVTAAAQAQLSGASDIWLGRFHPTAGTADWLTYLGGSGREELSAIALDLNGEAWLAGATTSDDLAVVDPLQAHPGGGQDGLIAQVDTKGATRLLSYFGGAGDDRLRSLTITTGQQVQAGGESQSDSIPELAQRPAQIQMGLMDGLWLQFHKDGIYAVPEIVVGKGLGAGLTALLVSTDTDLPVTAAVTDPDLVQVSQTPGNNISLYGLADSGRTELLIVAPGLPTRRIPVILRPGYVVNEITEEITVMLGGNRSVNFPTCITHPDTGEIILQPMAQTATLGIWLTPNPPNVVQVTASNPRMLHGMEPGQATIRVEVTGLGLLGPPEIRARVVDTYRPAVAAPDVMVGKLFQSAVPLSIRQSPGTTYSAFPVRITTEDPALVLLAAGPNGDAAESVTITYPEKGGAQPVVWVRGMAAAGTARVRMEVEGYEPVWFRVALAESALGLSVGPPLYGDASKVARDLSVTTASLETWSTNPALIVYTTITSPGRPGFQSVSQVVQPGAGNRVSIVSSNGDVVCCTSTGLSFDTAAASTVIAAKATRLAAGTAELRVTADAYMVGPPITVTVYRDRVPMAMNDLVMGKHTLTDLCSTGHSDFPPGGTIVATTGDPSKLLFQGAAGGQKLSTTAIWGCLRLVALADSGDVPVKFESPGLTPQTLMVHLIPTYFRVVPAWGVPTVGGTAHFELQFRNAVKPNWLWGSNVALWPSFTAEFSVTSSDSGILRPTSPTLRFGGANPSSEIEAVGAGTAEVRFEAVSDTPLAPEYATARVTVLPRSILESQTPVILGKDLQWMVPLKRSYTVPQGTRIHVRSSDPSRVLLSTSAEKDGSAEVDIDINMVGLWAQALADSGEVSLIVSLEGYPESRIPVRLYPSAFGVFANVNGAHTIYTDRGLESAVRLEVRLAALDPATGLPLNTRVTLRPGAAPRQVMLQSSNASLGRIYQPAPFIPLMESTTAYFRADFPGETELSVVPQPEMAEGGKTMRVRVVTNSIRLQMDDLFLGENTQRTIYVYSRSGGTSRFPATLTSSDPSRVTVSDRSDTVGGASATAMPYWTNTYVFYANALAGSGTVTLTATGDGVETGTATVRLEPTWFTTPVAGYFWSPLSVGATVEVPITLSSPSQLGQGTVAVLRPGIGPVQVPIRSSNAQVISVPALVEFRTGKYESVAYLHAEQPGTATITLGQAEGFLPAPEPWRSQKVSVAARKFRIGSGTLYKGLLYRLGGLDPLPYPATYRLVSSDPSKLRLSFVPTAEGVGELNAPAGADTSYTVYGHAIDTTDEVKVSATAEGFEPVECTIRIAPPYYSLAPYRVEMRAGTTYAEARVSNPDSTVVRPGAEPVVVDVVSSDPAVVVPGPAVIQPGQVFTRFTLTAKSPGTAVITVGSNAPESSERIYVTVTAN